MAELAYVCIREHEPVLHMTREKNRVTTVRTPSTTYQPGLVMLATGAWTGLLAETLHLHLPMQPVKGQMLLLESLVAAVHTPFNVGEAVSSRVRTAA